MTISVICDSCRKTGSAGTGDFTHLDLLDFTPVPRQGKRVEGWTAERQRAFIAALATTGSVRRAAKALGALTLVAHAKGRDEGFLRDRN